MDAEIIILLMEELKDTHGDKLTEEQILCVNNLTETCNQINQLNYFVLKSDPNNDRTLCMTPKYDIKTISQEQMKNTIKEMKLVRKLSADFEKHYGEMRTFVQKLRENEEK